MARFLLIFSFYPKLIFSQEVWNSMPPISFPNTEITDMITDNDTVVMYGTGFNNNFEWKQGLVIAKLDSNGTVLHEKIILDALGDKLAVSERWGKIINTSDGGYIATAAPVIRKSAMLIKFDNELNISFIKEYVDSTLISNFWYTPREVKNGYLLYGTQQFPDLKIVGFVKYVDYQGEVIWEKRFSFVDNNTNISDLQLVNDTVFIFTTTDQGGGGQVGSVRSGIYKINFQGEIIDMWQSAPNAPTGGLLRVMPLVGGDVITYGFARKGFTPFGTELLQPVMTRFDTNFNIMWTYYFGRVTSITAKHLQKFSKTIDGNYFGVGQYGTKVGTDVTRGHGWVYKFSAEGDSLWGRTFPTPLLPDEYPNGGILYGAGILSSGNIMAGGLAEDGQNRYCWLVKITNDGCMDTLFCQTSDIYSHETGDNKISIYPNPANDQIHINASDGIRKIVMFDSWNRIVNQKQLNGVTNFDLPITDKIPDGVYFLKLIDSNNTEYIKKIVVSKF
jgi:hypothetical protein